MARKKVNPEYVQGSLLERVEVDEPAVPTPTEVAVAEAPVEEPLEDDGFFTEADLISRYTRAQALEDRTLVDVSDIAHEAGFVCPVAVTAAVWARVEAIPARYQGIQDVQGRLWDLAYMAMLEIRRHRNESGTELRYRFIMHHGRETYVTLKMVFGPGDDGEMVVTIMLPDED